MRRLSQLRDDSGQVLVVAALCMVVLIGFLGLAVDIGAVRHEQRRLQNAADATALAAALEVRVCGSTSNCGTMQTAVQKAMVENGYSGATLITQCASAGTGLTVMVNNPTCIVTNTMTSGSTTLNRLNYVETQVSETAPLYFSRIFGFTGFSLKARAQAARGIGGPCLYALNPTDSGTLNVAVGLGFRANCGVVVESSSPSSVNCLVGLGVTAPYVQVSPTGGGASLLCLGNTRVTQAPLPVPADPLAYLPAPAQPNAPCGKTTGSPYTGAPGPVTILPILANITFNPGVYCGGITITASVGSTITFNPGTYIISNYQAPKDIFGNTPAPVSSGFVISVAALSTIQGKGVMFYNQSNNGISLTLPTLPLGLSNFAFSAPTSGQYGGILFWQAKNITNTGTFLAPTLLSGQQLNGVIYEPGATVSYAVNVINAGGGYNGIVADKVQFNAGVLSTISNDYSSLQSGSPLGGDHSELVQ
ncbi:Tad domain-containing protein [Terriglobus roseus]|uniref:Putative Tad-like Flp pilus-assembly n=1 Tax=Terriglobus roseus TaxID=392734 RepID=A0A1G7PAR7_9BACT|nr:Tad domain-containing protein [Terriglobus roseus]SDF83373.1 Putative Tad-like Flp pilus-assembly [Terriglobus roseus]